MKLYSVLSFAILMTFTGARAEKPGPGAYVLLGTQSGRNSATMAFVDNFSLSIQGNEVTARTLWVRWPEGGQRGYFLKDDIYYCDQHKISHRYINFFDFDSRQLTGKGESRGLIDAGKKGTLGKLVFNKVCERHPVRGANYERGEMTALWAQAAMSQSLHKAGPYAYPRSPLPYRIGFYPTGIASTANIFIPPNEAYEIPPDGTGWIINIYRAPDGHLVFYYYHGRGKDGESNFYDAKEGRDLFPGQGHAMASSPGGWLSEKLRPKGLELLSPEMAHFSRPPDKDIVNENRIGSVCSDAYPISLSIKVDGYPTKRLAIFRRLPKPKRAHPCEGPEVLLHYSEENLSVVAMDEHGFFALSSDHPLLIHFDWNGRSAFFSRQHKLIAVPYDEISGDLESTNGVRHAEAIIAKYESLQSRGALPVSSHP